MTDGQSILDQTINLKGSSRDGPLIASGAAVGGSFNNSLNNTQGVGDSSVCSLMRPQKAARLRALFQCAALNSRRKRHEYLCIFSLFI
jgi:hypothetical protein